MRVEASLETLMSVAQMTEADRVAPQEGVPSMTLMENAGRAVADAVGQRFAPRSVSVLCGPGNNGGDGYVAARILRQRGWPVRCLALADTARLKGDAAEAFRRWDHPVSPLDADMPAEDLLIDALFGAGLSRPLEGEAAALAEQSKSWRHRIVSIDVPSGIHGDTGQPLGRRAFYAGLTVTFVRRKPAHLLIPGRVHCGTTILADIGMPEIAIFRALGGEQVQAIAGGFAMPLAPSAHKYARGHCLVVSGGASTTGASRLAALGAARAGAGLTTIAAPTDAAAIHAAHLTALMVRTADTPDALASVLEDARKNAIVIGPGLGTNERSAAMLRASLAVRRSSVLDADALSLVAQSEHGLRPHPLCVMTPHGGEFARLAPDLQDALPTLGKVEVTRQAARRFGCVVVYKGADTVIADETGQVSIDDTAQPWLATAGTGDVLAGLIGGLLAQGLPPFDAACAGVWLHGAAARHAGPGLLADDLPGAVPGVLSRWHQVGG